MSSMKYVEVNETYTDRYLELDSTYRNRMQDPNPASFTALISQSGTRYGVQALDPISNAAPSKIWVPSQYTAQVGAVLANPTNNATSFLVNYPTAPAPPYPVSTVLDFYVGSTITVGANPTVITSWVLMSTNAATVTVIITVSPSLPATPPGATVVTFLDGTDIAGLDPFIFIPNGVAADSFYANDYIIYNQTTNTWRPISSYDGRSKLAGLNISAQFGGPVSPTWMLTHIFTLRISPPQEFGTLVSGTLSTAVLPATSSYMDLYTGNFLRITGPPASANVNLTRRITAFNPATLTVTVNSPFAVALTTEIYEILQFTRDNMVPFTYTGSMVSQQELVCYEIQLINLVLPNVTLTNGGRVAFYPYVYVELQNISSFNTNIIYSNNPHSVRRLFRCAIDDIPTPLISPFIKIDGDGMKQTIKFKINESLRFAVYLANGKLLDTVFPEYYSPQEPNPFKQISAMFRIKRL